MWSTPALLRLGLYAASFATLFLLAAALLSAFSARDALIRVGRQTAPGILTADRMESLLANMDASAVQELTGKNVDPGIFEARRQEAANAIIGAAENMSDRDLEQAPLQKLGIALGSYTARIQQARDEWKGGDKRYLEGYARAAAVMDTELMPAALQLDKDLSRVLESSYTRQREKSEALRVFLTSSAFLTGFTLLALQWFLAARTRRVINPLLFAATILLIGFCAYAVQAFERENQQFRFAKESVFDQEHARLRASARQEASLLGADRHKLDPLRFPIVPKTLDADLPADGGPGDSRTTLNDAIEEAFQDVSGFEISAPIGALAILLATFLGVLPRLREYSL